MISRKLLAAMVAALVLLTLRPGAAAEPLHVRSPAKCETERGTKFQLQPGFYVTEDEWSQLDVELKRLQDEETRLNAENRVLKKKATDDGWGWKALTAAFAAGAVSVLVFK